MDEYDFFGRGSGNVDEYDNDNDYGYNEDPYGGDPYGGDPLW